MPKKPKGRKTPLDDARKQEGLFEALRKAMPLSYACDLVGVPRQTVYDRMNPKHASFDEAFRTKVAVAKAEAIKGLVALTGKQNGAWKLLKNLAKEEFKEHVEIKEESKHTLLLDTGEDEEEIPL